MNSFGYGILGGIAGGAEGLIEQRRQEAEEAKAMNLARFQQQLSQQNYEFQGKLDEQRDIAAEGREATREDEVRAVAGADEAGVAVFADKKGNLYRNGQPYTGPVYEKGLKRERDAMDFSKTFTDENGQIVAYDPKNPGAQYVVGKDGNYKPKGELSEAAQLAANARLSELNEMGITDANVGEVNAIRKKLGLPTFKKVEVSPAKEGKWWWPDGGDKPAVHEFKEDWQSEEPTGRPEVLPKMGAAGGRDIHSAIVQVESNGDQSAVSNKGATGRMQLMPATAKSLGVNPKDALQNVAGGVKLFDDLLAKYKNEDVALAAYNWGEPKVDKWLERGAKFEELPAETQGYIKKVRALTGGPAPASAPSATGEAQAATVPPKGPIAPAAPVNPEIIPKQEKKWYDHPLLTGSLDAGELASKPVIAAADAARETVSAGVGAVKGVAQFANQLRKELTEQEYQALMREKGQRSDDEFFSLLKDFGIAGVKSWLNSGNVSKNAEKFYGKPGNDLNKYLR